MRIVDYNRFQRLLRTVRDQYGSQTAMQDALGISQGHLSRLLNPDPKNPPHHVTRKTAVAIARGLRSKPRLYREFWRYAILGRKATRVYDQEYQPWLRKALRPFTDEHGGFAADGFGGRCIRLLRILGRRQRRGGGFEYPPPYGSFFVSFDRATAGHDTQRRNLALLRAVAPLLASEDSGGIERGWRELDASGKLGPYLKAALKCEEILLNRSPDIERAQEIAND